MSDTMTYLTDATMITAVVPAGRADDLLKVARDVGASGGIVHQARGTGARELLGLPWSVAPRARRLIASFCWAGVTGEGAAPWPFLEPWRRFGLRLSGCG
jgi:hypothetical protein